MSVPLRQLPKAQTGHPATDKHLALIADQLNPVLRSNAQDISSLHSSTTVLQGQTATNLTDIASLKASRTTDEANIATLQGQVATMEAWSFVGAAYRTASSTSSANNAETVINYVTQDYDSGGGTPLVTTGATWNFKAPVAGKYLIQASLGLTLTAACDAILLLNKSTNGGSSYSDIDYLARGEGFASGNRIIMLTGSTTIVLNANDLIRVTIFQNSGGTITTESGNANGNYVRISKWPSNVNG